VPYVPVPKDLTRVKTKVAFNLTKRQLICFGLGGLIGIPVYLFTKGRIGNEPAALLMIVLMMPFFMFGVYEKDGQPLEKRLKNYINVTFLRAPVRPYRTNNGYAAIMGQTKKEGMRFENKKTGRPGEKPAGRKKPVQKREGRP